MLAGEESTFLEETLVTVARSPRAGYELLPTPVRAPEIPAGEARTVAMATLRHLLGSWGLDSQHAGSSQWNPLGALIPSGSRVVLKPNWVRHRNPSGGGLDCLLTHASVIEAVLDYVGLTRPREIVLGDAPVQGCDFAALRASCRLDEMVERFRDRGLPVDLRDFRRTVLPGEKLGGRRLEDRRGMDQYVLFDLQRESLLEPLAAQAESFRVTMYNPDLLLQTHAPGRHQYLIAREIIDADVVISLPKLKTHKKAGITGALKNMVGINGHKEYLPHHRKGGRNSGGDCYESSSWLKRQAEDLLDAANRLDEGRRQELLARSAEWLVYLARVAGSDDNLEGSWYGNDTVWRTCLDLQRILHYGQADGTLAPTPRRRIITITDAILAGEGEGPMSPTPVAAGFMTAALNVAAAEWVHAQLMGFDPQRIPLVREAFGKFSHPLASFPSHQARAHIDGREVPGGELSPVLGRSFLPSRGWRGHCEKDALAGTTTA